METKREFMVRRVPTKNRSFIYSENNSISLKPRLIYNEHPNIHRTGWNPQHLHFTTNEKPNAGDWYIVPINDGTGGKFTDKSLAQFKETDSLEDYERFQGEKVLFSTDELIIGSCDKCAGTGTDGKTSCTKCGGSGNKYLPHPSKAFAKKYCNKKGGIDKVLVEYEVKTITKGTSEFDFYEEDIYTVKIDSHNTITTHPIKKSWSREEVIELRRETFQEGVQCGENGSRCVDLDVEELLSDF